MKECLLPCTIVCGQIMKHFVRISYWLLVVTIVDYKPLMSSIVIFEKS